MLTSQQERCQQSFARILQLQEYQMSIPLCPYPCPCSCEWAKHSRCTTHNCQARSDAAFEPPHYLASSSKYAVALDHLCHWKIRPFLLPTHMRTITHSPAKEIFTTGIACVNFGLESTKKNLNLKLHQRTVVRRREKRDRKSIIQTDSWQFASRLRLRFSKLAHHEPALSKTHETNSWPGWQS